MNLPSIPSPATRPARQWALVALLASTAWLAGCAAMQSVQSDVSSYGSWTASQSPGSFVIERLPSQQQSTPEQDQLEQAASAALQQAGFRPAAAGSPADFTVQIGARISRTERSPWDDPMWWGAWGTRWSSLAWYQPGWAWQMRSDRSEYQREVAVLIRERASGQAVYEARARNDGITRGSVNVLAAMYAAAMKDFPNVQPEPHPVTVALR